MHRRALLLSFLAIAALASSAGAGDARAPKKVRSRSPAARQATARAAAPEDVAPVQVGDGVSAEPVAEPIAEPVYENALPARGYVAQHPIPNEPLGFSQSRFDPSPTPIVDPAASPGVFDTPDVDFVDDPPDPEAPAPAASSGEWLRNSHWYTEQSVVYMQRNIGLKNALQLARDFSSSILPADQNRLDIPLDSGWEPGWRSTIGRYLGRDVKNRDHSVEFTFLGLTHWNVAQSMTAQVAGSIFSSIDPTFNIPVYNFSNTQGFEQASDFNSYEVNYRIDRRLTRDRLVYTRDSTWVRQAVPSLLPSIFAGVRAVFINESLDYNATSSVGTGRYDVITHNNLVGPQIGTDWFYELSQWRLGARFKAGTLVNWASQDSVVRILNNSGVPLRPNRDEFVKDHTLAFVGELNAIGEYRFRPNFGLRVSYDLVFVSNLAIAQNQLTFFPSTPPEISLAHGLFFQGVSLGVEWSR